MITQADLDNWFTYHSPEGTVAGLSIAKTDAYKNIRYVGKVFAESILANTPSCPDQTVAIRKVREAVMVANQAIACEGK